MGLTAKQFLEYRQKEETKEPQESRNQKEYRESLERGESWAINRKKEKEKIENETPKERVNRKRIEKIKQDEFNKIHEEGRIWFENLRKESKKRDIQYPDEIIVYTIKWYKMTSNHVSQDSLTGLFSVDSTGGGYKEYKIKRKNKSEFLDWVYDNGGKAISSYIIEEKEQEKKEIKTIDLRYKL